MWDRALESIVPVADRCKGHRPMPDSSAKVIIEVCAQFFAWSGQSWSVPCCLHIFDHGLVSPCTCDELALLIFPVEICILDVGVTSPHEVVQVHAGHDVLSNCRTGCFIISVLIRTYYICYVRLSMVINHISFLRPMTDL